MARFTLKSGLTNKDLGKAIFAIAKNNMGVSGAPASAQITNDTDKVKDLLDSSVSASITLVYDSKENIHIVIPNIADGTYNENDLANEAMGAITIMGCAS